MEQEKNGIKINQDQYIKHGLQEICIRKSYNDRRDDEVSQEERSKFRAVVGQLNWVATQTRPDISFDVCDLSTKFNCATVGDIMSANKTVKRVKDNPVLVFFLQKWT